MFLGGFTHSIDPKGRVSIPAGLRMELQRQSDEAPILAMGKSCLILYPFEQWLKKAKRLGRLAFPELKIQQAQRLFASRATPCPIDSQGRILIPPEHRKHAKLQREVTIAGVMDRIEIWDRESFEKELESSQESYDEVFAEVAKLVV
jgi:MraZ protein